MTLDSIRFGEKFELERQSRKLYRDGRLLRLERIPTEVLLLLIEKNGQIVTREEMIQKIWGDGVFFDTDNSINVAIRKVRHALRDDPDNPQFIQTITGYGYRFIATLPLESPDPIAKTPAPIIPQPASDVPNITELTEANDILPAETLPRRSLFWRVAGVAALAGILVAALAVYLQSHKARVAGVPGGRSMLAVLPFDNFTGDAAQEYFSDGLTEEMISQLGNIDPAHIGVIARTSVMHYKHSQESLSQIGKELGVQYVVEGSVRRDSNRVRVTAQLIRVTDQSHVWARQYDRDLNSLLALQTEIAGEVADEIEFSLTGKRPIYPVPPVSQSPNTYQAYDSYLKGRYFWNKRTRQGFQQAIEYFQQAIASDPNYARAYAGLADSYTLLRGYSESPEAESMSQARNAALKAIALDDRLAEAHTSLALISETFDFDWETAEKEFRRAIELDPNYATAHEWYAEYLGLQGRFGEALAESERARRLDPLSLIIAADKATILYYARQYDAAIAQSRAIKEMDPAFPLAHMALAAYVEKGRFEEALAEIKDSSRESDIWTSAWQAYVYGRSGREPEAQKALEKVRASYEHGKTNADPVLWAYLGTGDREQALVWLEKAYATRSNLLTTLKVNPAFDPLRNDPRFIDLLRQVHLAR
jgi:TolB-like protein/DNA-binding winged helix-turn-helix (wHTH) protein/Tfp pilus assembly protein PilF